MGGMGTEREKMRRSGGEKKGGNEADVCWLEKKKSDCAVLAFVVYSSWEETLVGCWFDHFRFILRERRSEREGGRMERCRGEEKGMVGFV